MKKYRVGQVLFIVSLEQNRVVPCQVVEEVTRSTLKGVSIVYKIRFDTEEVFELQNVKGDIYTSLDQVRAMMLEKVTTFVNKHVHEAGKLAQTMYGSMGQQIHQPVHAEIQTLPPEQDDDGRQLITMPDGTLARAKITGLEPT